LCVMGTSDGSLVGFLKLSAGRPDELSVMSRNVGVTRGGFFRRGFWEQNCCTFAALKAADESILLQLRNR